MITSILLFVAICAPIIAWILCIPLALKEMGFSNSSIANCPAEFIGWMADEVERKYIHNEKKAYSAAFDAFHDFIQSEAIWFGDTRYAWTKGAAKEMAFELIGRYK